MRRPAVGEDIETVARVVEWLAGMRQVSMQSVAIAALVALSGCGSRGLNSVHYIPPKPAAGNEAVLALRVLRPRSAWKRQDPNAVLIASDYDHRRILVRCIGGTRDRRSFSVYYLQAEERGPVLYTFSVSYAGNDFEKRVIVRDARGRAVERNAKIGGLPAIFQDFLFFDNEYLPANSHVRKSQGNGRFVNFSRQDGDARGGVWTIVANWWSRDGDSCSQVQRWRAGEWLWCFARGGSKREDWLANRISFTGPGSP